MTPTEILELAKRHALIGNVGTEAALLRFVDELMQPDQFTDIPDELFEGSAQEFADYVADELLSGEERRISVACAKRLPARWMWVSKTNEIDGNPRVAWKWEKQDEQRGSTT